jgi:ABC-2 type transport system permease protein
MSIRRVSVLVMKEFGQGWRNVLFVFAVVGPVVLTIVISLLFGTIFSGKARLGLVDEGASQLGNRAAERASWDVTTYASSEALAAATAAGSVDMGVVLPPGFDEQVQSGETATITAYMWGESTLKNRAVATTAFATLVRDIAGQEVPVEIETSVLGDRTSLPWETRLLPFIVLMAMILGGSMVPAASLVGEKQKRTLRAVTTTSASLGEVFAAKGLLGAAVSTTMAVVTLILNRAWGPEPVLLLVSLALGAVMAACLGLLLGAFIKDIGTLLTVVKAGGLLLYAPALVYMFPEFPQWTGRIFPTYYLIQPVIEITQQGGTWAGVAPELAILVGLNLVLIAVLALVIHRAPETEGALNPA